MLIILKKKYLFDFIYLDNAVYLLLSIVKICVKVRSKRNVVEKELHQHLGLLIQLRLVLKQRLHKRPKNQLIYLTIYSPRFFLIFKHRHFTSIQA